MGERIRSILRYDFNSRSLTYDGLEVLVEYYETAILEGDLGYAEELESLAGQRMEGLYLEEVGGLARHVRLGCIITRFKGNKLPRKI